MSFLTLTHVTKSYGDLQAVIDLNLSVEKGEFVSLLGPSGCGKTTTLQMIAGFIDATRGRITLDGHDITHVKPNRRGLGVVFQSYALFPHMTVAENVGFGLEMRGMAKADRSDRVNATLALVRLATHAHRFPRELSGGQRQRVAIARALVIEPPVLLLDEPMSNLDAKLREDMRFELRAIQRKVGTTTVMVTHDQSEALSISDRVVVMEAGRITQVDAPYRAYERPSTPFVSQFIGKANMLEGIVAEAQGAQIRIDLGHEVAATGHASQMPAQAIQVGAPVTLCIRPEKMRLCPPEAGRLKASIAARFFLGSQWLYRLDCVLGEVFVCCQNDGGEPLSEGQAVGIDWNSDALRFVTRADARHG
jgi:putative spermidine/putrescine transport system ATP-binding protein